MNGIRTLDEEDGPETVRSALRVLSVRLTGHDETRALGAPVEAALAALEEAMGVAERARDARVAATGTVNYRDARVDDAVASMARGVKDLVDGNLEHPLYLRLFKVAPSTATANVGGAEQAALVDTLIHAVKNEAAYAPLLGKLPALERARAGLEAAEDHRQAAEAAELDAWNNLQVAEQAARRAYEDALPKLMQLFPGEKRLVASFFPPSPKRKK